MENKYTPLKFNQQNNFLSKKNINYFQNHPPASDRYFKTKFDSNQKQILIQKEGTDFNQRNLSFKKYTQSYKITAKTTYNHLQTTKSLIFHSKLNLKNQKNEESKSYTKSSNKISFLRPREQTDRGFYHATNNYAKNQENPFFDKFLEMAKKQKQRHVPACSLMFTPKKPLYTVKRQPFIIESLRQTEDTISEKTFRMSLPKASDFHQVRMLGKGKNGQVYLAIHKATGFACAMKIISKKDLNKGSSRQRQVLSNQLLRQIKVQLYLSNPNLIELYGVFSDRQNIYLIQELGIDGQLYDLMKKKQRFSEESTALLAREILMGLKFMHENQIIHRDLKPQNIVLIYVKLDKMQGTAKLCDFGCSVYCPLDLRSTLCGTPLYLSPEVLIGYEYNEKIDIWAFGTLIYELFVGENPFKIKNKSDLKKIITEEVYFSHNFPKRLRSFLQTILKKNSNERPTAIELEKHEFFKKYAELQTSEELANI